MGSLTVEINMRFQIPPAQCGRCQTPRTNKLNHTPTLVQEGVDRDTLLILILIRHLESAILDCNYFLKKTKKKQRRLTQH